MSPWWTAGVLKNADMSSLTISRVWQCLKHYCFKCLISLFNIKNKNVFLMSSQHKQRGSCQSPPVTSPIPSKENLFGLWTGHCISESFMRSKTLSYTSNICMHSPDSHTHSIIPPLWKKYNARHGQEDQMQMKIQAAKLALEISSRFIRAPGLQTETRTDV